MMIITARSYSIIMHITTNPWSFVVNLSYLVCKNIFQSAQNIFDDNYCLTAFPGQILDIVKQGVNWKSDFTIFENMTVNPISEGIQNHEVLKAGAIQWPPHISGVSGPILMILDSKQGFLRSRNWLVRVSRALHVSYTCQARVIVSLPQSPRNHLRMCMNM